MVEKQYKIYCLRSDSGAIAYIGKTFNSLSRRFYEHMRLAKRGKPLLKAAWLLSNKSSIELIELCTKANWRERELYWCEHYNPFLNKKRAGGGSDGQRIKSIDSIKDRLGLVHDKLLAKEINADRKTVAYYRQQLGIPALGQDRNAPRKKGRKVHNTIIIPQNIINLLGAMPDYKLEGISGISKKRLMTERHKLGIQSYAQQNNATGKFSKGMPHPRWSKDNGRIGIAAKAI